MGPKNKCGYNANFMKQELELQSTSAVRRLRESLLPGEYICLVALK